MAIPLFFHCFLQYDYLFVFLYVVYFFVSCNFAFYVGCNHINVHIKSIPDHEFCLLNLTFILEGNLNFTKKAIDLLQMGVL